MRIWRVAARAFACVLAVWAGHAYAQQSPPSNAGQQSGREVLLSKCFQCHTDATWRDQRQDGRAWEATLYRMVGRGALWTSDEIRQMAEFLGTSFGPNSNPSPATPSPAATQNPAAAPSAGSPPSR